MRKFYFVFILISNYLVAGEISSSIDELVNLEEVEKKFIGEYTNFIAQLSRDVENLKVKLKAIESEHADFKNDPFKYVTNPLNAFLLTKRLSYGINKTYKNVEKSVKKFKEKFAVFQLPESDLNGAVEGFLRLSVTYELKSSDLARGIIDGKKYRNELTAEELFVLGSHLLKFNQVIAVEYLKLSYYKNIDTNEIANYEIFEKIVDGLNATRKYEEALNFVEKMQELQPENKKVVELKKNVVSQAQIYVDEEDIKVTARDRSGTNHYTDGDFQVFAKTCTGERTKSVKEKSKLFCRYQSHTPFTKIAPFKVEEANLLPYVAIMYDVTTDREADMIINLSKPRFHRAEIMQPNSTSSISNSRVAKIAWHWDIQHELVAKITQRVGDMSGLNMKTAEILQVQNYGIGGHYILHHDFTHEGQEFNLGTGNRIATTLFYLSDVEKGGETVFPILKIRVPARKNTAVFWHNLSTSGHREYDTIHGACPVLVGSKWVMNKWLHEYGQEFHRPCELEPRIPDKDYHQRYIDN